MNQPFSFSLRHRTTMRSAEAMPRLRLGRAGARGVRARAEYGPRRPLKQPNFGENGRFRAGALWVDAALCRARGMDSWRWLFGDLIENRVLLSAKSFLMPTGHPGRWRPPGSWPPRRYPRPPLEHREMAEVI
jgi:hypothetical protein